MNLRKLLKEKGISNDIIRAVEEKTKRITEQQEQECREKALAMTKVLLNEALRTRKNTGGTEEPVSLRKLIISE